MPQSFSQATVFCNARQIPPDEVQAIDLISEVNSRDAAVVEVGGVAGNAATRYMQGSSLEIKISASQSLFRGRIVGIEPRFSAGRVGALVLRAFGEQVTTLRGIQGPIHDLGQIPDRAIESITVQRWTTPQMDRSRSGPVRAPRNNDPAPLKYRIAEVKLREERPISAVPYLVGQQVSIRVPGELMKGQIERIHRQHRVGALASPLVLKIRSWS